MPATNQKQKSMLKGKKFFGFLGACLILMWCTIPVWNCIALLLNRNFVFFEGREQPLQLLFLLACIIICFILFCAHFLTYADGNVETEGTVLTIGNIFVMLLGLVLLISSMRLSATSVKLYDNMMNNCEHKDEVMHRLYEYSQVLHNIRDDPTERGGRRPCQEMYTVEECVGYEDSYPYTGILKDMEHTYKCSGFCYQPYYNPVAPRYPVMSPPSSLLEEEHNATAHSSRLRRGSRQALLAPAPAPNLVVAPPVVPTTLFSHANYDIPCEGMLARDFKNFVGDIGFQMFWQGVYFIVIAIMVGFIRLIGIWFYTVDKR